MNVIHHKLEKAIIAVISVIFVIWSTNFIYNSSFIAFDGNRYFCLFDDAMISMRYAWNFSHGLGLVWNQGVYIQGYTNLLMTLLMSFATLVFDKCDAVLFIQVLGVFFMLASAYTSMKISIYFVQNHNTQRQALVRVLSFFCTLSYYPLVYWALMGMETGLLTILLLLSILYAFSYTKTRNPAFLLLLAGCLGLAYLTRNDSIIFALIICVFILWETYKQSTDSKIIGHLLVPIGLYFVFVAGQLIFQYLYYGELLPNTYTLKLTGMPLLARINNGIGFIVPFLIVSTLILFLSSIDLIFNFRKRKLLLFSIVLLAIGYQIYVGGDPWNYWRLMSPTMPLLFILYILAGDSIISFLKTSSAGRIYLGSKHIFIRKYINELLLISLVLIGLLSANVRFYKEIALMIKPYTVLANQMNVNTSIVINRLTMSNATVGVFYAGSIPYFVDRKAIDFLGKSDRYISHLPADMSGKISWNGMSSVPGHNKYDLNYSIKTLEPTYVEHFKWGLQDLSEWAEKKYVKIEYSGVSLYLLRDAPTVYWSKVIDGP